MATSPNLLITHLDANVSQPEVPLNTGTDLLDEIIAGILVHDMASDADYTLSTITDPQEWQHAEINITDTGVNLTTARNIIVPINEKVYIFRNDTAQSLTLKTSAGTGITVTAGSVNTVRCDGTDVVVTTAAGGLNNVVEDTTPQLGGDLDTNGHQVQWSKGADVASGTALPVLTDGNYFDVTGTTTVTSIDTIGGKGTIKLHFDGVLTLTHHATDLILPNSANYSTAAGDEFEFTEYAAGDWRCTGYALASGQAIAGAGGGISNVVEDTSPQAGGDFDMNANQMQWSKGADVASGTALPVLTDGNYFDITGTTTVTSIDTTGGAGTLIKLHFDGILTLTHHATNLVLPGASNITTAVGDEFEFIEYGAGTYRCTGYVLASGEAVVGGAGGGADLDTANTWTKGQRGETTALSDGATITPDMADSNFFSVTLGGNRTLANPTNLTVGQSGSIFITQDGTGSRTLAYGSFWDFAGGSAPTLSTAINTVDRLDYLVRTTGSIHAVLTRAWA